MAYTDFTLETVFAKILESQDGILGCQEDIEILGVTANAGVLPQGKCSRYGIGNALPLQEREDFAEQTLLFLGNVWRSRRRLRYNIGPQCLAH